MWTWPNYHQRGYIYICASWHIVIKSGWCTIQINYCLKLRYLPWSHFSCHSLLLYIGQKRRSVSSEIMISEIIVWHSAFSECVFGRYGVNCEQECHCRDQNEACHTINGTCDSGCDSHWTGPDCQRKMCALVVIDILYSMVFPPVEVCFSLLMSFFIYH